MNKLKGNIANLALGKMNIKDKIKPEDTSILEEVVKLLSLYGTMSIEDIHDHLVGEVEDQKEYQGTVTNYIKGLDSDSSKKVVKASLLIPKSVILGFYIINEIKLETEEIITFMKGLKNVNNLFEIWKSFTKEYMISLYPVPSIDELSRALSNYKDQEQLKRIMLTKSESKTPVTQSSNNELNIKEKSQNKTQTEKKADNTQTNKTKIATSKTPASKTPQIKEGAWIKKQNEGLKKLLEERLGTSSFTVSQGFPSSSISSKIEERNVLIKNQTNKKDEEKKATNNSKRPVPLSTQQKTNTEKSTSISHEGNLSTPPSFPTLGSLVGKLGQNDNEKKPFKYSTKEKIQTEHEEAKNSLKPNNQSTAPPTDTQSKQPKPTNEPTLSHPDDKPETEQQKSSYHNKKDNPKTKEDQSSHQNPEKNNLPSKKQPNYYYEHQEGYQDNNIHDPDDDDQEWSQDMIHSTNNSMMYSHEPTISLVSDYKLVSYIDFPHVFSTVDLNDPNHQLAISSSLLSRTSEELVLFIRPFMETGCSTVLINTLDDFSLSLESYKNYIDQNNLMENKEFKNAVINEFQNECILSIKSDLENLTSIITEELWDIKTRLPTLLFMGQNKLTKATKRTPFPSTEKVKEFTSILSVEEKDINTANEILGNGSLNSNSPFDTYMISSLAQLNRIVHQTDSTQNIEPLHQHLDEVQKNISKSLNSIQDIFAERYNELITLVDDSDSKYNPMEDDFLKNLETDSFWESDDKITFMRTLSVILHSKAPIKNKVIDILNIVKAFIRDYAAAGINKTFQDMEKNNKENRQMISTLSSLVNQVADQTLIITKLTDEISHLRETIESSKNLTNSSLPNPHHQIDSHYPGPFLPSAPLNSTYDSLSYEKGMSSFSKIPSSSSFQLSKKTTTQPKVQSENESVPWDGNKRTQATKMNKESKKDNEESQQSIGEKDDEEDELSEKYKFYNRIYDIIYEDTKIPLQNKIKSVLLKYQLKELERIKTYVDYSSKGQSYSALKEIMIKIQQETLNRK